MKLLNSGIGNILFRSSLETRSTGDKWCNKDYH